MATDYYRFRMQGLHQTEYNECVMHFRGTNLTAADYIPNAGDLLLSIENNVLGPWLDMFPTSYEVLRMSAAKASVGGGGEVNTLYQVGEAPGTVSGGAASQQLCPVVTLIPTMGTKTAGKIYLPCIAESQIAANAVNSTWQTNLGLLMAPMIAGFGISSIIWDLVVYSRKNNTFTKIVDYSISPVVGFQRKRARAQL
jgi:hypothetical protein